MQKTLIPIFSALMLAWSCQSPQDGHRENDMPAGLEMANMDPKADPKADFYRFANGGWLDKTKIPGDEGRWGGFGELRKKNDKKVLAILESASADDKYTDGSDERKAVDFFSVGMDSTLAEQVGTKAIGKWLSKIDEASSVEDIQVLVAEMHTTGYSPFHSITTLANLMDSKTNALYLGAGGLGLPNRDYYTKTDEKSVEVRQKYQAHLARMFELIGAEGPEKKAQNVFAIENDLALVSLTPIEARNIPVLYNPMVMEQLQELSPDFDWSAYFSNVGLELAATDTMIVTQPKFVQGMNDVLSAYEMDALKDYLTWNIINQAADYLNNEMVAANFDFYGRVLRGTEQMRPRWQRVLGSTNGVIGEAIGKVYVAETFPPEAKVNAEEMVENLMLAFDKRIRNLEWMSEETKEQALKKLNNLTVKIGYPNKWKDYSELKVEASGEMYSYLGNMENAWKYQFRESMDKIGKPVDKEEWGMNPQTVNAYFNPLNNEIVFPAAILQPPFYNYTADAAINYGGMGAVIGHEISHGFDDQGSRFDAEGNMVNWWTEDDKARFEERTTRLVAQFDSYEALDSVYVQGKLTLGENIGDLGGLNAAYDALQIHMEKNGRPELIDGFSPEQRFFISWATIWRTKYKDEALRNQILTDPHSPGMFRAVGPLENMETFFTAFDIKEGDPLYKPEEERVIIW